MSKIKCLQCGEILESKYRHDFQQCHCDNQTAVDGGRDYLKVCGVDLNLIEIIPTPNPEMIKVPFDSQKQPSSVGKIEAEKKYAINRLREIERKNCCCPTCGYEFDEEEIKDSGNVCSLRHGPYDKDQLIGDFDDYEWCY